MVNSFLFKKITFIVTIKYNKIQYQTCTAAHRLIVQSDIEKHKYILVDHRQKKCRQTEITTDTEVFSMWLQAI